MKIFIQKHIKIPKFKKISRSIYPWDKMKIGDSFLVPSTKSMSARTSFYWWRLSPENQRKNVNVTIRPVSKSNFRVWMIKN